MYICYTFLFPALYLNTLSHFSIDYSWDIYIKEGKQTMSLGWTLTEVSAVTRCILIRDLLNLFYWMSGFFPTYVLENWHRASLGVSVRAWKLFVPLFLFLLLIRSRQGLRKQQPINPGVTRTAGPWTLLGHLEFASTSLRTSIYI